MKKRRDFTAKRVKMIPPWGITGYAIQSTKRQANDKRYLLERLAETGRK